MREINYNTDTIRSKNESIWLSTLKLTINLFCHIFISLVVLMCLWFSCRSTKLSVIELHIVLCVLGYQLFMSQGVLVLSKFNSWSMYLKRRHRRCLHWFMEFIGVVLVIVGSIEVIKYKKEHFTSLHGILGIQVVESMFVEKFKYRIRVKLWLFMLPRLKGAKVQLQKSTYVPNWQYIGLCALMTTAISVFNGMVTTLTSKLPGYGITRISLTTASKCVHGVTGIATLFFATASLHYGYNKGSFRRWISNENIIIILKVFTWMFTIFVGFEFWIIIAKRIKYRNTKPVGVPS